MGLKESRTAEISSHLAELVMEKLGFKCDKGTPLFAKVACAPFPQWMNKIYSRMRDMACQFMSNIN